MTDLPPPAQLDMRPAKKSPWRNISVIWLVPVLALAISLGVAWRSYSDRGVAIEIVFENAAGVTAGETSLRYRDVVIGKVEQVGFSDDLATVIVSARVNQNIAPFLDAGAQFWVVRPEVSAQGVSGLATVLSGVYIEGQWDKAQGQPLTRFEGLSQRPIIDQNDKGTRVTLKASDGNIMAAGTPVFYRGVRVGRIETPRLDDSGSAVLVDAFIEAPHDQRLTSATRFWDTSGFAVSFGAGGLKLDVGSFATLISGGVAFNTFFSGGYPVDPGHLYDLYEDEEQARENAFTRVSSNTVMLATVFDGGVSGLETGASVEYKGLKIGKVATIAAFFDGRSDALQVNQLVTLEIDPEALGLESDAELPQVLDFLDSAIESGVRARLNKANLLSSSLIVELVKIPDAAPATVNHDYQPYPLVPTVETNFTDINATVEDVMKRINGLKIEEVIQGAINLMASIEALATDQNTRAAPEALVALLGDTRSLMNNPETQALPAELRAVVSDLRMTMAKINDQGAIERLVSTLESADSAAANLSTASEQFPALVEDLRTLAAKANGLQAEELMAAATALMQSADGMIGTEDARALPPTLNAALEEVRTILAELRAGGAVNNANAALASVNSASQSLERATADLPALAARLDQLVARTDALIVAYGDRSDFNTQTLAMLREVRSAARSIASLASAIERNPNSLLLGK